MVTNGDLPGARKHWGPVAQGRTAVEWAVNWTPNRRSVCRPRGGVSTSSLLTACPRGKMRDMCEAARDDVGQTAMQIDDGREGKSDGDGNWALGVGDKWRGGRRRRRGVEVRRGERRRWSWGKLSLAQELKGGPRPGAAASRKRRRVWCRGGGAAAAAAQWTGTGRLLGEGGVDSGGPRRGWYSRDPGRGGDAPPNEELPAGDAVESRQTPLLCCGGSGRAASSFCDVDLLRQTLVAALC